MARYLLYILILITAHVRSQPNMHPDYSPHDSCPDPAKYHIAQLTVYSSYSDNNHVPKRDSTIEKFDHNGNLISISEFMFSSSYVSGRYISTHYFTYDERNRILSDSAAYEKNTPNERARWVSRCTYDTSARTVVEHCDILGKQYNNYIWYNDQNEITLQYQVDKSGDTISFLKMYGDTSIYAERSRNSGGEMSAWDTSYTITTPTRVTEINDLYRNEKYYDHKGKLIASSDWFDHTLYDSTLYLYNSSGQLIHITSSSIGLMCFDPDYITSHTEYTYDKTGRRLEKRYSREHESEIVYITRYTYNDKGLLTELRTTEKEGNGREQMRFVEVWEYEFW